MSDRVTFPITPGVDLELVMPEGWQALEGSHTIMIALEQMAGALSTLHAKNVQYGDAWREQGWMGNVARIMSKTTRLRNMLWRDQPLDSSSEPVQDTLQDLLNLCVFALLNRQAANRWGQSNGPE